MSFSEVIEALRGVYSCVDNEERKRYTLQLLQWEKSLSADNAVQIGVDLLKSSGEAIAVQAYGAVVLRHTLHARLIRPAQLPVTDLLAWYCNETTLAPLLRSDLLELLIECMIYADSALLDSVFKQLCSTADSEPRRLLLLVEMTLALVEPDFDRVPRDFIGKLKRSVVTHGGQLLRVTTMSLYNTYMASSSENSPPLSPELERCVEATLRMIGVLAPLLPLEAWQEYNLPATVDVLLRWGPTQRSVITCASSLLRSYCANEQGKAGVQRVLLTLILRKIPSLAAQRDIAALDDVLTLMEELPKELVQLEGMLMIQSLLSVFSVPSIQFAQEVVQLMDRVDEQTLRQVDAVDIYKGLRMLLPKNLCHPTLGINPEGRALAQEQFGFDRLFEDIFADFRRGASKILTALARLNPERTNHFLLGILTELPDPRGTAADPRTRSGFVQQSSLTYAYWEATQFMMEFLSAAFELSSSSVGACASALLAREPSDAVLRPVFFNMVSYFLKVHDSEEINMWNGTIDMLLNTIGDESIRNSDDLDINAARRRAHTLLVQVCVEHGHRFASRIPIIIKQLESMLMRSGGTEKSLLYEALVALTAVLPPPESDQYLQKIIDPLVTMLASCAAVGSQDNFNHIVCGFTLDDEDSRRTLQGCLNTIAAILRRCQRTPYIIMKGTELFPSVGRLLLHVHSIDPSSLPPRYRDIVDLGMDERELFLPGKKRKSEAHLSNAVRVARSCLMNIRVSLYQIFGSLSPILPAERYGDVLSALVASSLPPTHAIRALSERCLLPIGREHPSLLLHILQLLNRFFCQRKEQMLQQRVSGRQSRSTKDDVIESKQWCYYAKDVLTFLRVQILDSGRWKSDRALLNTAAELAVNIFDSWADARSAERLLLSLVELTEDPTVLPEVGAALREIRVAIYARLITYVTQAPSSELPPNERGNMAFRMSEPYVKQFPNLAPSFTLAGTSEQQQETLNAHLLVADGVGTQRRRMKEFLLKIASEFVAAMGSS